jgi:hypothetical protein
MKLQENILRKTIPFLINSFNQNYYLKKLIKLLKSNGFKIFMWLTITQVMPSATNEANTNRT